MKWNKTDGKGKRNMNVVRSIKCRNERENKQTYLLSCVSLDDFQRSKAIGFEAAHFAGPSKRWTQKYWCTFPPSPLSVLQRSRLRARIHSSSSHRSGWHRSCWARVLGLFPSFIYFAAFIWNESVFIHLRCTGIYRGSVVCASRPVTQMSLSRFSIFSVLSSF